MRLRVLGCSGGSAAGRHPTSFLIDECIAVDAGAVTANLSPEGQERVDHVVLSHAHLDHVTNLPFLLDNRFARQTRPIALHAPEATLAALRNDLFNNRIWPDFTALRNAKSVALELHAVAPGETFPVAHLRFTASAMTHPVQCFGYLIADGERSVYIAGDTGSLDVVKAAVAPARGLEAIVVEVSWPDRMEALARKTGHVVPKMLRAAWPLHPTARVLVSHIKPFHRAETVAELEALRLDGLTILEDGMDLTF